MMDEKKHLELLLCHLLGICYAHYEQELQFQSLPSFYKRTYQVRTDSTKTCTVIGVYAIPSAILTTK